VYSDTATTEVKSQVLPAGVMSGQTGVAGGQTSSWTNTGAFIAAWSAMIRDGRYKTHSWTIKVDPDTVLLPDRLRSRLVSDVQLRSGKGDGAGVYVKNCENGPQGLGLFGSIEMVSREGVDTYAAQGYRCDTELQHATWGEDFYMQKCFDLIGLTSVGEWDLLKDSYCTGPAPTCGAFPQAVAFHPYKTPWEYFHCMSAAIGGVPAPTWPAAQTTEILMKK